MEQENQVDKIIKEGLIYFVGDVDEQKLEGAKKIAHGVSHCIGMTSNGVDVQTNPQPDARNAQTGNTPHNSWQTWCSHLSPHHYELLRSLFRFSC